MGDSGTSLIRKVCAPSVAKHLIEQVPAIIRQLRPVAENLARANQSNELLQDLLGAEGSQTPVQVVEYALGVLISKIPNANTKNADELTRLIINALISPIAEEIVKDHPDFGSAARKILLNFKDTSSWLWDKGVDQLEAPLADALRELFADKEKESKEKSSNSSLNTATKHALFHPFIPLFRALLHAWFPEQTEKKYSLMDKVAKGYVADDKFNKILEEYLPRIADALLSKKSAQEWAVWYDKPSVETLTIPLQGILTELDPVVGEAAARLAVKAVQKFKVTEPSPETIPTNWEALLEKKTLLHAVQDLEEVTAWADKQWGPPVGLVIHNAVAAVPECDGVDPIAFVVGEFVDVWQKIQEKQPVSAQLARLLRTGEDDQLVTVIANLLAPTERVSQEAAPSTFSWKDFLGEETALPEDFDYMDALGQIKHCVDQWWGPPTALVLHNVIANLLAVKPDGEDPLIYVATQLIDVANRLYEKKDIAAQIQFFLFGKKWTNSWQQRLVLKATVEVLKRQVTKWQKQMEPPAVESLSQLSGLQALAKKSGELGRAAVPWLLRQQENRIAWLPEGMENNKLLLDLYEKIGTFDDSRLVPLWNLIEYVSCTAALHFFVDFTAFLKQQDQVAEAALSSTFTVLQEHVARVAAQQPAESPSSSEAIVKEWAAALLNKTLTQFSLPTPIANWKGPIAEGVLGGILRSLQEPATLRSLLSTLVDQALVGAEGTSESTSQFTAHEALETKVGQLVENIVSIGGAPICTKLGLVAREAGERGTIGAGAGAQIVATLESLFADSQQLIPTLDGWAAVFSELIDPTCSFPRVGQDAVEQKKLAVYEEEVARQLSSQLPRLLWRITNDSVTTSLVARRQKVLAKIELFAFEVDKKIPYLGRLLIAIPYAIVWALFFLLICLEKALLAIAGWIVARRYLRVQGDQRIHAITTDAAYKEIFHKLVREMTGALNKVESSAPT